MAEKQTITLRGHHINKVMEEYYAPGLMFGEEVERGYGKKNVQEARRLVDFILHRDVNVTLITSLDGMCKYCQMQNESCIGQKRIDYDKNVASKYGLEIGKTYTSTEILDKIKERFGDLVD